MARLEQQWDSGRVDQISMIPIEVTSSHPLEHSGVAGGTVVSIGIRKRTMPESLEKYTDPDAIRETSDNEPMGYSAHNGSPNEGSELFNTDGTEDTEDGDAIMVGVVGSAGWTNDVEVEFMIDTGFQVTILATSVFEKMCKIHPQVKSGLIPCTRRLVSADSSPLTVMGQINLNVAFPVLQCDMCCVVASIGSDGLLGTEALQSCLPHQLDLQTGPTMGRRSVDFTITPTETHPRRYWLVINGGGFTPRQRSGGELFDKRGTIRYLCVN